MKTIKLFIIPVLTLFAITSCNYGDVKINTTINEDGTCSREVSYSRALSNKERDCLNKDSIINAEKHHVPSTICVDGMVKGKTTIENDTIRMSYKKDYASVEEMTEKTPLRLNGKPLKSKTSFEKSFKWFFTEYTYTETFETIKQQLPIPIDKIAGADTVSYWFTGMPNIMVDEYGQPLPGSKIAEKSNKIEKLFDKWCYESIATVYFNTVVENYDSVKNPPLTKEEFIDTKDFFVSFCYDKFCDQQNSYSLIEDKNRNKIFSDFYNSNAYSIFVDEGPCNEIAEKNVLAFSNCLDLNIPYSVTMPGEVHTGCNVHFVHGDGTGYFTISGERLAMVDYTISVTSRKTNIWAFIVTGLVIAIAIGSFFYERKKNSNKK